MKLVDKQNIFNSGILSSKLYSRDDLKQYTNGIAAANNFICSRYGPMEKRVGTEFIYDLANPNEPIYFIPFIFSIDEALLLEFRPGEMRVYAFDKSDRTQFGPIASPEDPSEPFVYETTLTADQIENISYVQSLDVLYLAFADGKTPPHKLSRLNKSNTQWNLEEYETEDGPYLNQNYDITKKMKIEDVNTDVSTVSMQNIELSSLDEGRWIRICTPRYNENTYNYEDKWSYGKIIEVGNSSWLVSDSILYTDVESPIAKTSKKAGTVMYRNTKLTSQVGQVTATGTEDSTKYIVVGYKKYYYQGEIAAGKYTWRRKDTTVYLDVEIKDNKAYKNNVEIPIENVQIYSDAEYQQVIGSLVSITNDGTLVVSLRDITDSKGTETIKTVGSSITVEWKYRNFTDEEDQSWMTKETSEWRLGVWHPATNSEDYPVTYPTKVTIHQQRLVWAGMTDRPWVWTSNSYAYQNYAPSDFEGEIKDTNSIVCDISTDKISDIFWIKSVKSLLIGTELGELRMFSSGTAITPADVVTMRESSYGCHNCEPVVNDDNIVFVQRLQRTLRSLSYDYNQDSFVGPELTILAESLTTGGIKKIVFQKEPNNTYWCLKEDGTLLTLTYDKSQDVIGWSQCTIAGANAKVVDLAILPAKVNQQDMLILAVERTINDERVRYLELLTRNFTLDVDQADGVFLDSSRHYIYQEPRTVFGDDITKGTLGHLEGETVRVTSDGAIEGDYVVTNGQIEIDNPSTNVQIGLPYDAYFETLERDYQDKQISTKLSKLRIYKLRMYIERSLGIRLNRLDRGSETRLITFDPSKNTDEAPALVTGKVTIDVASAWDCDYRLKVVSEPGLPCTVSGITIGLELNEL